MASTAPQPTPGTTPQPDPRAHFGLTGWPFTQEISATRMWRHPGLDELVDDLEASVSARMSVAVIAPTGTGKTALLRRLVNRLEKCLHVRQPRFLPRSRSSTRCRTCRNLARSSREAPGLRPDSGGNRGSPPCRHRRRGSGHAP